MIKKTSGYYILNEQDDYKLSFVSSVTLMDHDGNVVEQKKYSEEGELIEIHSFVYSEKAVVLMSRVEYLLNGKEDAVENIFDDKDQLVVSVNSFFDDVTQYERHKYSIQGNRIETAVYDEKEQLLWRTEFKYDDLRNLIQETEFDENGVAHTIILYEYKEKQIIKEEIFIEGNLISSVHYGLNEEEEEVNSITTFDSGGNIIDKSIYIQKDKVSMVLFQEGAKELSENSYMRKTIYDSNDLMIFSSYINELVSEENIYEYDSLDRLTKELHEYRDEFSLHKSMFKHVYEVV